MSLTSAQSAHVSKVFPECRADMARYMESGAKVAIYRQNECGADVQPYAIAVAGTDFWIECCETAEAAMALAGSLGLNVIEVRS